MTIVFKVSNNIKLKMIDYYSLIKREKTPPYALFQADEADTIITLYESGKVVFQGPSADIDANMWMDLEKSLNNRDILAELAKEDNKKEEEKDTRFINKPTIGSDEVGTGDYFGPIIVTAAYVGKEHFNLLYELGVRDSKKINDDKILKIAPTLIREIPHVNYILSNKEYNTTPTNMNKIKAIMHNKVLCSLIEKTKKPYDYVVVDQFCHPRNYFTYIKEASKKYTKITFVTKAEDKCLSVAAASIISRYLFIKEFEKLGNKYNIFLKKGAGVEVDKQGAMLVKKHGENVLFDIAKLNFKNTEKINNIIKAQEK
ncbi:MAG: ribonuclease HIII [Bacilli bacterium]|nr:ribonuclease HIII [Bacilli bacterium]